MVVRRLPILERGAEIPVAARYGGQLDAEVVTGKATYLLSPRHRLVGYLQREGFQQSNFFAVGASLPLQTSDALPSLDFPVSVWKGEYNAALTDALYFEARVGGYHSDAVVTSKSAAPRMADVGANTVSGGAGGLERLINRPQVNGSLSFLKSGWGGSHTFTIGGEYMSDRVVATNPATATMQLRLNAQQRRPHAGPDPARPERVEERSDDGGRVSSTTRGASLRA